jgi:hypothetical protein
MAVPELRVFYWVGHVCIIPRGAHLVHLIHSPKIQDVDTILIIVSFLEMIESAAASFPASVYEPPPESASNAPSLNVNLGGMNLSLGGPAGTGVYRTSGESSGLQADGIRDGVRSLLGKVKQGVDKIGLQ